MIFEHSNKEKIDKPPCPRCNSEDMVVMSYDILHTPEKGEWWYVTGIYCTRTGCDKMIIPGIIQ